MGVSRHLRLDERRRQVPNRHRCDPPLCLRRFPGIADEEGIDHRQGADHQFRETRGGERDCLARQPFEGAVRTHVNERIDLGDMPKPERKPEQRVTRR